MAYRCERRPTIQDWSARYRRGPYFDLPFTHKLEELGYVEGKNLLIERRNAEGSADRLREFADEFVRQRVDVIVSAGTPAGFAAKQATNTIPIVLGANSDPVGVGLVASLARPGGNATGTSLMAPELSAKRLDILRTLAPGISRFAMLWDLKSRHGTTRASNRNRCR